MEYQQYKERLWRYLTQDLGIEPERIQEFPKGFRGRDPEESAFVRFANREYFQGNRSNTLLADFLVVSTPILGGNTHLQRLCLASLHARSKLIGIDRSLQEVGDVFKTIRGLEQALVAGAELEGKSYEELKSSLVLRPMYTRGRETKLQNRIYRRVGDMALVLNLNSGTVGTKLLSAPVDREKLDTWGMTGQKEKVLREALQNTERLSPTHVLNLQTLHFDLPLSEISPNDVKKIMNPIGGIILSVIGWGSGAMSVFYPSTQVKMRQIYGGDFILNFMDVDRVILFPHDRHREGGYKEYIKAAAKISTGGNMVSTRTYICTKDGIEVLQG